MCLEIQLGGGCRIVVFGSDEFFRKSMLCLPEIYSQITSLSGIVVIRR